MSEAIFISLAILASTIFLLWLMLNLFRHGGVDGFLDWRKECLIRRAAHYGALARTLRLMKSQLPLIHRGHLADEGLEVGR